MDNTAQRQPLDTYDTRGASTQLPEGVPVQVGRISRCQKKFKMTRYRRKG